MVMSPTYAEIFAAEINSSNSRFISSTETTESSSNIQFLNSTKSFDLYISDHLSKIFSRIIFSKEY